MKVSKTFETEEGGVIFEGTLDQEEVDYLIGYALNSLLQRGTIPFKVLNNENLAKFSGDVSGELQ